MASEILVLESDWPDYALLDSGERRKLERFGPMVIERDEPKAWWRPTLPDAEWAKAQARLTQEGTWELQDNTPRQWLLSFEDLRFQARLADTSRHVGVFPEQSPHWRFILEQGSRARDRPGRLLNLFGYTGAASLVALKAGFSVTHVDASKPAMAWVKENQRLSGLDDAPLRLILDDAQAFAAREIRRNKRYDAILLDPPSYGRGPKKEIWKAEKQLTDLLGLCRELLDDDALFLVLTMYNIEASALMLGNVLADALQGRGGAIQVGELTLAQTPGPVAPADSGPRRLPLSIFGRWAR